MIRLSRTRFAEADSGETALAGAARGVVFAPKSVDVNTRALYRWCSRSNRLKIFRRGVCKCSANG